MALESLLLQKNPNAEERVHTFRVEIEKTLDQLVSEKPQTSQALLYRAARYSLLSSAKRLRPLLMLATTEALGGAVQHALIPSCALELIHTYSLIHDDLPCMDNDDLRRGRPTLHKVYPEGHALLTGDFLLTYAFEVLATSPHLADGQKVALTTVFAKGAGDEGMIGGQLIDLDLAVTGNVPSWELLCEMHNKKTSALLAVALESGAIIANASTAIRGSLKEIGQMLGLAFQIVDDILDITGTEQELGKPVGSDIRNAKITAVSLLGLDEARLLAQSLLTSAESRLDQLCTSNDYSCLLCLVRKLVCRTS